MKASLLLTPVLFFVSVRALCDGTPDVSWQHYESCDDPNLPDCNTRCQNIGYGC
ncbi:uncharacterized protein THITE_2022036, partial [Thermothielavioides terrestris NRRL 8126]